MAQVLTLAQNEAVRLDSDRLGDLYSQLGEAGAEDVVCRATEELAQRLSQCERMWRHRDFTALRKCTRSLGAIADQIGMSELKGVAADVARTIDACDHVATSATFFRLLRIGERSMTALWDQNDLSI